MTSQPEQPTTPTTTETSTTSSFTLLVWQFRKFFSWLLIALLVGIVAWFYLPQLIHTHNSSKEATAPTVPEAPPAREYTRTELLEIMNQPLAGSDTQSMSRAELEAAMAAPVAAPATADGPTKEELQAAMARPLAERP